MEWNSDMTLAPRDGTELRLAKALGVDRTTIQHARRFQHYRNVKTGDSK